MSYTTPELLLVGAAQNLVREASPTETNKITGLTAVGCTLRFEDATAIGDEYQIDGNW